MAPERTPPPLATSRARRRPSRVPWRRARSGAARSQSRRRATGKAVSKATPIQPASQSSCGSGTLAGVVNRWAAATRSSSGVSTLSKLASSRALKSAGVACGR